MKVTLKTLMAGPEAIVQPGETVEMSEAVARDLMFHGYARPADAASERIMAELLAEAAETTEADPQAETTALKSSRKRA